MTDLTRTVPERQAQLLERLAKVFAMLADAVNELADGRPDKAEELLEQLSAAESFVTVAPCVVRPMTAPAPRQPACAWRLFAGHGCARAGSRLWRLPPRPTRNRIPVLAIPIPLSS